MALDQKPKSLSDLLNEIRLFRQQHDNMTNHLNELEKEFNFVYQKLMTDSDQEKITQLKKSF